MLELDRRRFLNLGLVGGGLLLTAGCKGIKPVFLTGLLGRAGTGKRPTGPVSWVTSTCCQCAGGCGIRVRLIAGEAKKIEGNPLHPINRGTLCPRGQAGLQVLYDPDRLEGPVRRIGPRGSGRWERLEWPRAITEVADRLTDIRRKMGPEAVVLMVDHWRESHKHALLKRFAYAFGTPNFIMSSARGSETGRLARYFTQGRFGAVGYNWERARFVFSFGAGLFESSPEAVLAQRVLMSRRGSSKDRPKLVCADPRLSLTAAKSDEWLPIRPGTDGALALGMAHVIIAEDLHDKAFLEAHSEGFDSWVSSVVERFTPEDAAKETGIDASTIVRLAREFAHNRPAIAIAGGGAERQSNGLYNVMLIESLNALLGSIGPHGVFTRVRQGLEGWPAPVLDDVAARGLEQSRLDGAGSPRYPLARHVPSALTEALRSKRPYAAGAVLFHNANPAFSEGGRDRLSKALSAVPLVVSFSPFLDETASLADLVLPDHTFMEAWDVGTPETEIGAPMVELYQPVVRPVYNTMSTGDALIRIAQTMGGHMSAAFPWKDGKAAMRAGLSAAVGRSAWSELLETGVWVDKTADPDALGLSGTPPDDETTGTGVESAEAHATVPAGDEQTREAPSRNGSGRFEFVSSRLMGELESTAQSNRTTVDELLERLDAPARGQMAAMPHYEPPPSRGEKERYPLLLNIHSSAMHVDGGSGNQPWLRESFGVQLGEAWDSWAELNPATGRELGIQDKEEVWVESEKGRVRVKARLFAGVHPSVVNIPQEFGHTSGGRWARGLGVNPNEIAAQVRDRLCGTVSRSATRVMVYRVNTSPI